MLKVVWTSVMIFYLRWRENQSCQRPNLRRPPRAFLLPSLYNQWCIHADPSFSVLIFFFFFHLLLGMNKLWSTFITARWFLFLGGTSFPLLDYPSQSQLENCQLILKTLYPKDFLKIWDLAHALKKKLIRRWKTQNVFCCSKCSTGTLCYQTHCSSLYRATGWVFQPGQW